MEWNVYYYNINLHKLGTYNIFDHWKFVEEVKHDIKKFKDKEVFSNQLKTELMYYFWSKSEWEVLISPWVGGDREKDTIKIDVFDQVMMNWDKFVDYVWDNRKEFLKID